MTGLGYFLYRKRSQQDRSSRRFEKSLGPREQRENRGSWDSKLSFSRRPIHISVPIVSRSGSSLSNRIVEMPLQGSTTSPQQRNQIPESRPAPRPINPARSQPQPLSNTSSFTTMGIPPAYQSSALASISLVPSFKPNPGLLSPVRMIMRPSSKGSLHAMKINGRAGGEEIPGWQRLERSPPSEIYNRMLEDVKTMPF